MEQVTMYRSLDGCLYETEEKCKNADVQFTLRKKYNDKQDLVEHMLIERFTDSTGKTSRIFTSPENVRFTSALFSDKTWVLLLLDRLDEINKKYQYLLK